MELKTVKSENICEAKVNVTCDEQEWKKAQKEALIELAKDVTLKGFRKGNAPLDMAKKAISQVKILNKAADKLIDEAYSKLVENKEIKIAMQPTLSVDDFSESKLAFTFNIITMPEVTLGEYKGLTTERKVAKVLKADVDAEIEKRRQNNAELEVVEDGIKAENGNTVIIDFVGYVDGKTFEGGDAKNYELVLGSNSFVPGFEEQLVGTVKGEKKDVNITFPENYVKELAGMKATFKVTVNEVKKKVVPELNDDFAKDLDIDGVDNLEQLANHVKKELKEKNEVAATNKQYSDLIEKILSNAKFDVHANIIEEEANAIVKNFENRMEAQGIAIDDYYKIANTSRDKLMEDARVQANNNLKHLFVFDKIAQAEEIKVTKDELETKLQDLANQYGMKVEDIKKNLGNRLGDFVEQMKEEKVNNFLKENNNKEEKKETKEEK